MLTAYFFVTISPSHTVNHLWIYTIQDVRRAKRTFVVADVDKDGFLDADEYLSFNNPRAVKEMEV